MDFGEFLDSGESCDICDSLEGVLVGVMEIKENSLCHCEFSTSDDVMEDKVEFLNPSVVSAHLS